MIVFKTFLFQTPSRLYKGLGKVYGWTFIDERENPKETSDSRRGKGDSTKRIF